MHVLHQTNFSIIKQKVWGNCDGVLVPGGRWAERKRKRQTTVRGEGRGEESRGKGEEKERKERGGGETERRGRIKRNRTFLCVQGVP